MSEKQKIEGVNNKELKAFFAIICVLIILIIFEIFFFEGRTEVAEEMMAVEQELQQKASVTVAAEQKTVYKALNNVISMMNNKEYEKLYDILKDDYKDYYFREYKNFENFIQSYARLEYYPKYNSYYRDGDLYYIIVEFLQPKYTREMLLSRRVNKVDTIVLQELNDGNFKVALNGFVENILHNKSKTVEGVTFTLQNSVRNTETMETTVLISNNSSKSISVSTSNIQPEILGGNSAKLSVTSSVNLEPGNVGLLTIEYYFQYDSGKEFRGVTISDVKFDDGTPIGNIYLSK